MPNIINALTARIEDYRKDNKQPCKNYATENAAETATKKVAQKAATHFDKNHRDDAPEADYLVFYVEAWGRWVGCINMSDLMRRPNSTGGYIGICGDFFTF